MYNMRLHDIAREGQTPLHLQTFSITLLHDITIMNSVRSGNSRVYACCKCSEKFTKSTSLTKHIHTVHEGKMSTEEPVSKGRPSKLQSHKCGICGKTYAQKSHLKTHLTHFHEGLKPFDCTECSKFFFNRIELESHIRDNHEVAKRFKCDECPASFSIPGELRDHVLGVHKKLHKCPKCLQHFTSKAHIQPHIIARHRNERRFKCPICFKAFKFETYIKTHVDTVHAIDHLMHE